MCLLESSRLNHGPQGSAAVRRIARIAAPAWVRYVILFILAAVLSGVTIWWGINPHDEGLILQAGARVADGQLPYRDFYANYGPGQYFLVGGLDLLFGPSLLTWRVVRVVLDATVAVLAYSLARRDAPEPLALAAWLAVAAAMALPSIPHPNPAAIALGLGAILIARRSPVSAGALSGLAVAFRFDLGLSAAVGAMLAASRGGSRLVTVSAGMVGAIILAPFVLAAPGEFWDQTLGFALDQQSLQRLPLPGAWEGGFEPNRLLQYFSRTYCSVAPRSGSSWRSVSVCRGTCGRRVPLALAGVAYLLARTDGFI